MPFYDMLFEPDFPFTVFAVQAGDAAEMVSRLNNAVAAILAADVDEAVDFKLAGAGSGLNWEAWFVLGEPEQGVELEIGDVRFVAAEAGNPEEAALRLNQQLMAVSNGLAPGSDLHIHKVEVAGAGDGPTYMAVAVYTIGLAPG